MNIFPTEKLDGLEDAMKSSARLTFACQIVDNVDYKGDERVIASLQDDSDQMDLYSLTAILASTGWNLNDDVFVRDHIWAAKDTPVDKQLNMMHDDNEIIGHMTGSVAIDFEGNIITEPTDQFDIAISAVIYRWRSDDNVRAFVSNLIDEIEDNKWAVSMECLFNDFDYAIIREDGSHHTLTRDQSTAFLTKHLRAYGGTGNYEDYKVGRVLKDITFSGIGIVDNPAGPRSEILKRDTKPFCDVTPITVANLTAANDVIKSDKEKDTMTVEQLQAQLDAAKAELAEAKQALADATALAEAAKAEAIAKKEQELTDIADQAKADVAAKDEAIEALKTENQTLAEEKEAIAADLKAKADELEEQRQEAIVAARRSQLVEAGVDADELDAKMEKFGGASDEVFASVVELLKETQAKFPFQKDDDKDKKDDKKKDDAKAEDETDAAEAAADGEVEPETSEASLTVTDEEEDSKAKLREALAAFATQAYETKKGYK